MEAWFAAALPAAWWFYGPGSRWWTGAAVTRSGPADVPAVALTFDDGPDPAWTPQVLAILAEHRARATFFAVGQRAARHPDLLRAAAADSHEIGHHTWSHRHAWLLTPGRTLREIRRGAEAVAAATGRPPVWFRPPWGARNAALDLALRGGGDPALRGGNPAPQSANQAPRGGGSPVLPGTGNRPPLPEPGSRLVLWSVNAGDWRPGATPETVAARVLGRLHPGAIVLLHDGGVRHCPAPGVRALPAILAGIARQGFRAVTLSEMIEGSPQPRPEGGRET